MSEEKSIPENLDTVKELLAKRKLVEELVHRQEMPRHETGEDTTAKQPPTGLHALLERQIFGGRQRAARGQDAFDNRVGREV